jgi:hypothetical protein
MGKECKWETMQPDLRSLLMAATFNVEAIIALTLIVR